MRPPAVAGLFYPGDPVALAAEVDEDLRVARRAGDAGDAAPGPPPKALVVPHAGYVYSGPVAASGYALLGGSAIERVVLLGPAHRVPVEGMAVPGVGGFATPLGVVPVDGDALRRALTCRGVVTDDDAHAEEHSLEVHLPFLQRVLGPDGWAVLPVVVGRTTDDAVAHLLDELWGGPETLVVVSTDLSHYHDAVTAARLDAATAGVIVAGDERRLDPSAACGAHPLRGLLVAARRHGLRVRLLDLRNSADTAGGPDRVVGYGAFAVG
ncbi:MAG: AmmeMemoRadiSam system protein B [Acidimicrobiales bacterium]|nr:AmmeMemoRadiSam system protein B [Acidimicrobiales bacterium]